MKRPFLLALAAVFCAASCAFAQDAMKITLRSSVDQKSLDKIGTIVFSDGNMVFSSGSAFALDSIEKIEFVNGALAVKPFEPPQEETTDRPAAIHLSADLLSVALPQKDPVQVNIYSTSGQLVQRAYSGPASSPEMAFPLSSRLTPGVYCAALVVHQTVYTIKFLYK